MLPRRFCDGGLERRIGLYELLKLVLPGALLFLGERLLESSARSPHSRVFCGIKAAAQIRSRGDTAGDKRLKDCERQKIFFRVEDAIHKTVNRLAALNRAGNLWNEKSCELDVRIFFADAPAELHERFRSLLGRHDAEVAEFAAPNGVGIVERDDIVDEVGTIVGDQPIGLFVLAGVEFLDEPIVGFLGSRKLETIDRAVKSGADELIPVTRVGGGRRRIGSDVRKMLAAILITQKPGELGINEKRNVLLLIHSVEIGNRGDSDPVVTRKMVIARENDPVFAGIAAAELCWAVSTNI